MSLITSLIGPVTGILDKFIEDKDQKAKLAHEIATMSDTHAQQALLAQLEINKAEAASGSLFKGGWRPFVGWVCGVAFAYHFVLQPLLIFILSVFKISLPDLPVSLTCLRSSRLWEDYLVLVDYARMRKRKV